MIFFFIILCNIIIPITTIIIEKTITTRLSDAAVNTVAAGENEDNNGKNDGM